MKMYLKCVNLIFLIVNFNKFVFCVKIEGDDNINVPLDFDEISVNIEDLPPKFIKYGIFTEDSIENNNLIENKSKMGFFTNYCGPDSSTGQPLKDGPYIEIDRCCMAHDNCPNYLSSKGNYNQFPGLPVKTQLFTKLQCNCDLEFIRCLRKLSTNTANAVRNLYTAVQTTCFDYQYPIIKCLESVKGLLYGTRCILYSVDTSRKKIWQWFDIPYSSSKNIGITSFPLIIHQ